MRKEQTTEIFLTPNGQPYPPHMQLILSKCKNYDDKRSGVKLKLSPTITDVTPKGYGPNE